MFKKLAFIALLSMGGLSFNTEAAATQGDTVNVSCFLETIKNSPGTSKWLATIIPFALALVGAEVAIRANRDNPDAKEIVGMAKFMRAFAFIAGLYFFDEWWKTDLKAYLLSGSKKG